MGIKDSSHAVGLRHDWLSLPGVRLSGEMAERRHYALDRLPHLRQAIRERMMTDPEFRSMCDDYDDAIEGLSYWETSDDPKKPERVAEFRVLVAELEREIATIVSSR